MPLIYDRTANDVVYAENHKDSTSNLKGNYNVSDLNRVEYKVRELTDLLMIYGYSIPNTTKTTWEQSDFLREADAVRYLGNVERLIEGFYTLPTTPDLPLNMVNLTYAGANAIEKILHDISEIISSLEQIFIKSGVSNSGQERIVAQKFRTSKNFNSQPYEISEYMENDKWNIIAVDKEDFNGKTTNILGLPIATQNNDIWAVVKAWNTSIQELDALIGGI